MKVLIVNGSPHIEGGCTDRALKEVEKTLNDNGIATERINIGNKDVRCKRMHKLQFLPSAWALRFQ